MKHETLIVLSFVSKPDMFIIQKKTHCAGNPDYYTNMVRVQNLRLIVLKSDEQCYLPTVCKRDLDNFLTCTLSSVRTCNSSSVSGRSGSFIPFRISIK